MSWLRAHGLISDYWQYLDLPEAVLADCRLLKEAEAKAAELKARGV